MYALFRELENMAHAGRKLPTQPPSANRPLILWAEDCVANGGPLPEMNAFGLPRKAVAGPYLAPVSFQGATALHLAAFYGHSGVTDLLLAAMACDVNACNAQVCCRSGCARCCQDYSTLRQLTLRDADARLRRRIAENKLCWCCVRRCADIV